MEDRKSTTAPTSAETESNENDGKTHTTDLKNVVAAKVIDELLLEEPRKKIPTSTNDRSPHVSEKPQQKLLPAEQQPKAKSLMSEKIKKKKSKPIVPIRNFV